MAEDEGSRREFGRQSLPVLPISDALRRRLLPWVDVEEIGVDGLLVWLDSVLPLLPSPHRASRVTRDAPREEVPSDRLQDLARDLVDCAGDRATLTIRGRQYFTDNQLLARRVKALEAILRTLRAQGHPVTVPLDDPAEVAGERYLPRR
jgi:hypothetical protein